MSNPADNLNQVLLQAMETYAERTCFLIKRGGRYQSISYYRFQTLTFRLVMFLGRLNLRPGERVVIAADNSLEWMVAYAACIMIGVAVVPVRTSMPPVMVRRILQDSGARLVMVQEMEHVRIIQASLTAGEPDNLSELTLLLINSEEEGVAEVTSLKFILAGAVVPTPEQQAASRAQAESLPPTALAALFYVPGKSGQPKGAMFDHSQGVAALRCLAGWFTFEEDDIAFTHRPWNEMVSLLASLHYFVSGVPNALMESYGTMLEDMQQASPTVMLSTPFAFDRFYDESMKWLAGQPESNQEMFQWALATGKEYRAAGPGASPQLRRRYLEADLTFFNQIRGEVGGRFRRAYSTSGSLSLEVADFFEAVGIPVFSIYSMTEAGGFPAINRLETNRPGSCGQAAPGYEIRIAEDGELLVRGETVMRGYWQQPDETRQVLEEDGWLHTGDRGYLDDQGYLYITGRKRHLMVLSTGRKIVSTTTEDILTASPFIAQAALFGEGKPYVSAMIAPHLETLIGHFQQKASPDEPPVTTTADPRVKALLDSIIGDINRQLDVWEQIREYGLLDQPLGKTTEASSISVAVRRHRVAEQYAAQIEALYPVQFQLQPKKITQVEVEPERLRQLLEKESILDAWLADAGIEFLFELAREKQIDVPSMVHICDAAATIAQMRSEEKPLSTAIIVGDPVRIGRVLFPSQVQLLRSDHIRRMRKNLVTLARLVDGHVLGYVLDKYGYVRGVNRLELVRPDDSAPYLGPMFRRHAAISRQCDALVFFVPAGGRQVRVFANGQLVGRYAHGDWFPEKISRIEEILAALTEQRQYDAALLKRVLRCAFQMSEQNLGAIFLIGNADLILGRADAPEISHFALIVSAVMDHLSDQELINFAKQDGATVIDVQGRFRGCMVLLRPGAQTEAEIGPGKGARHSSAAKMSAEASCLAITISQDGPITLYDSGRRILSL